MTAARAVAIAYRAEVERLASFLRARLSVLVACEKLVVPHLWPRIVADLFVPAADGSPREIKLTPRLLDLPAEAESAGLGGGPNRLAQLRAVIAELKPDEVLVIPNLDLLGGGGEKGLSRESRELTEAIYAALDCLVLAFVDPTLPPPEVIAARFAVRAEVEGLPGTVPRAAGDPVPIGRALITAAEAALFADLAPAALYKDIAGLNPVRLRQAMSYATQAARDRDYGPERPAPRDFLIGALRAFKAQSGEQFTVPDIGFEQIGGYDEVKHLLGRAIALMTGGGRLPDDPAFARLRGELIPRGFLFHGPPGTGKTLFAKAVANRLNATIRVVSGPEVTDMYVGESERKVRAIFAEARRNAPSVIVFDEIDSIAASRTGRDDGGSRAGNALVAQILTEMDGFRPDVPMLVIGTTNRLELIDPALLRPSRFQPVAIGLPERAARRHIAAIHAEHFQVPVDDALLDTLADAAEGLNGDEIRSLFRDACVGHWFEDPPQPMDPWQLGWLVGRLRTRLDTQRSGAVEARQIRRGERPRPSGGMIRHRRGGDADSDASDTDTDSDSDSEGSV
jgi:transitional endoplasmic reticulum ATPase